MTAQPTTTGTQQLDTGVYLVNAPCPRCGAIEEVLVALRSVFTVAEDETGNLRVRIKGKARDHDCRQTRLAVLPTEGKP